MQSRAATPTGGKRIHVLASSRVTGRSEGDPHPPPLSQPLPPHIHTAGNRPVVGEGEEWSDYVIKVAGAFVVLFAVAVGKGVS